MQFKNPLKVEFLHSQFIFIFLCCMDGLRVINRQASERREELDLAANSSSVYRALPD